MDYSTFNKVSFIKSITNLKQRPEKRLSEIAFIGRSNVGKSSLLNAICGRKNIAKVSSTPGKTQLINYFLVDELCYFVDLPGYGYAKLPKEVKKSWSKMIEEYLLYSENLKLICLLVDSRHNPMDVDQQMIEWLVHNNLEFIMIVTKVDKISKVKLRNQLKLFQSIIPEKKVFPFSNKFENLKRELIHFLKFYTGER